MKVIISGGGTGGHIFPALAIAKALKHKYPEVEILFVGAEGKMEMDKVPKAGFKIKGLPIRGIQRKLTWENVLVPFKLWSSLLKCNRILKGFRPDVAVGFGGYASGPLLWMAALKNVPTLIQEQNSYAGITNKILAKWAHKICVAFPEMENYFPSEKIVFSGNPIRQDLIDNKWKKQVSQRFFDLGHKKTILIFGGSLGASVLNNAVIQSSKLLKDNRHLQVIWQCGKTDYQRCRQSDAAKLSNVRLYPFIEQMGAAYGAADVVVCRAGALTISELCVMRKAAILVPSPNVAEDHQTKNAMTLVKHNAALLLKNEDVAKNLFHKLLELVDKDEIREELEHNIGKLATPKAAESIVNEIEKLIGKK